MNLKLIYFLLIILIFNIFIIKNNKCEDFTNLNTDNCPSNFPYRTRIFQDTKNIIINTVTKRKIVLLEKKDVVDHNGQINIKLYKKEKCAVGKEVCYGSNQWPPLNYENCPSDFSL